MIEYTLIRSRRQSVEIQVRDGSVSVRAPLRMPKRDIDELVVSKERWIAGKLAKFRERAKEREAFAPHYGDTVPFRGAEYPIVARAGARAGFDGAVFFFPEGLTQQQIKDRLAQIYRKLAKTHLTERTACFAARMKVAPNAVRISAARTRWGSCSVRRNISFPWRLALADDALIDYVVVHELAHLNEMNHSARFWAIVEGVLPDWRERKARLKNFRCKF